MYDRLMLVKQLIILERQLKDVRFPAHGSLYLRESRIEKHLYKALDHDTDPSGHFCVGPSCEREWFREGDSESLDGVGKGPCKLHA